jgi:acetyl-CoA carboxylase carboxyl transferase subunit alpha
MAPNERKSILLSFEKPLAELEGRIAQIRDLAEKNDVDVSAQLRQLEARAAHLRQEIFSSLTPAQRLQVARHPRRPSTLDYIQSITDEWIELHGDRSSGKDDPALVGGVARLEGCPVVILGHQKGRDTKDNVARNFGMASPGGYRKAMRLMRHADRFSMPIMTFIDTPGAYPGYEAEEMGQGEAIAYNLREMFGLRVPIICTIIGEGGSGGALGIGVGDRLIMFEHSVYTVASPEAWTLCRSRRSPEDYLLGFERPGHFGSASAGTRRRCPCRPYPGGGNSQASVGGKPGGTVAAYPRSPSADALSEVPQNRCLCRSSGLGLWRVVYPESSVHGFANAPLYVGGR